MSTFLIEANCVPTELSFCGPEVVLSVLLSEFRFLPSEKEIVWEMSAITIPTVKGQPKQPQLPLKVEKLRSST
jgi:hypothetical protein